MAAAAGSGGMCLLNLALQESFAEGRKNVVASGGLGEGDDVPRRTGTLIFCTDKQ